MDFSCTDEEKARPGGGASFTCLRSHALPAGAYRVSIRVFDDAASAAGNVGGRIVTRDFSLPASGGVVDVPLAVNAVDTCDATPSASAPACTGLEAHDVPCSLAEPLAFAWEGGLSFYGEASQLTPPATYGRRRTYYMGTMPDLTCATAIPRCTRDSRVVTTSDIARAINEPTVLAAYATTTPVYGYDYRANDGQILILRRPDGTSLGIGSTCNGCSPTAVANPLTPALSVSAPCSGRSIARCSTPPAASCSARRATTTETPPYGSRGCGNCGRSREVGPWPAHVGCAASCNP